MTKARGGVPAISLVEEARVRKMPIFGVHEVVHQSLQELREFRVVPRRIIRKICHRWIMWIVPWYLDCEGPRCKWTAMLLLREKITHPNLNGEGNAI